MAIFIIAILGTSAYRYSAAMNARKADLHTTAARTALLLCEGWRGVNGVTSYNPVNEYGSCLNISTNTGPDVPTGFTSLGSYKVVLENNNYYVTMSWNNISSGLRALNVIVSWDQSGESGALEDINKSYSLTTYVENPS